MLLRKTLAVVGAVTVVLSLSANGAEQERALTPAVIIKRMAAQYATLVSYQDNGAVETVDEGKASRRTDVVFRTYFARPSRLRFEWTNIFPMNVPSRENMIWCDGSKTYAASIGNDQKAEVEIAENLDSALDSAIGTSGAPAHTVAMLLMPSVISGFSITELSDLAIVRDEQFEGDDCYLIRGRGPEKEVRDIWISKKDYLLRKVRTRLKEGIFSEEIHRQIKRNNPLSPDIFRLKPGPDVMSAVLSKSKERLIRRLLVLIIPTESLNQIINNALDQMKELLPQVPEDVWSEVTKDVRFNTEIIAQMYIPEFDKHYDEPEIAELIAFYQTPLGKKVARVSLLMDTEASKKSSLRVRELLLRVYERLREKGYKAVATTTKRQLVSPLRPLAKFCFA